MLKLKQKLPLSYLLLTFKGRIRRSLFLNAFIFIWSIFYILYKVLEYSFGFEATIIIYPLLFWTLTAISTKRLHDLNKAGSNLFLLFIPIFGAVVLMFQLLLKKGTKQDNDYGTPANIAPDYLVNKDSKPIPHLKTGEVIINDVTRINPIIVSQVYQPKSIEELIHIVKNTEGALSIGGGRFSMGGQTTSKNSSHIDMRKLNKIISFSKEHKEIKVEAGIRWCDIQHFIDEHNLSIRIMQTYANFTVGGSLSVNCHGRYMGEGALILSVKAIEIVLANGDLLYCSRDKNSEIFFASIGGYNALGIIVSVELFLTNNTKVKRVHKKITSDKFLAFFESKVKSNKGSVFFNADMYPPHFNRLNVVTWIETEEKVTQKNRFMTLKDSYPLERYFFLAFTELPLGKRFREFIVDPILYAKKKVHWRNYEAGYDVAELEPKSRKHSTYVLLEYFVPIANFEAFRDQMTEIFVRHNANIVNVSIRHAYADQESYLTWAREEVFAYVVYYKQEVSEEAKAAVGVWTRELIEAVLSLGGTYYLPYQAHATKEQFHRAYPRAKDLFVLKDNLDPDFRFKNVLWNKYYTKEEIK